MSVVFISYRRLSALVHARAVYERLSRELGPGQVFIDLDDMEVGVDLVEQTNDQLRGCRVLLALIDPDWATATDPKGQRRLDRSNDFVRIEIATALRRGIRVVPILIGDAEMPDADALPNDLKPLARRHALALEFGLHDMHGNVWEWIQDCYDATAYAGRAPNDGSAYDATVCASRVLRGGFWYVSSQDLRAANRFHSLPDGRSLNFGFRVCRVGPTD